MALRIIGCGNLHRGDDAAGLLVVHRLREEGVDAEEAPGDLLTLMDQWHQEDDVVFVDAVLADAPPGTVIRMRPADLPRLAKRFRFSSHGIGIPELVGLASALGRLPRRVLILGIVGERFDAGRNVSGVVRRAVARVVQELGERARTGSPESAIAAGGPEG